MRCSLGESPGERRDTVGVAQANRSGIPSADAAHSVLPSAKRDAVRGEPGRFRQQFAVQSIATTIRKNSTRHSGQRFFVCTRTRFKSNQRFSLENKYSSIGPIYYEYGSLVLTYHSSDEAIQACYTLKEATYEERGLSGW